MADLNKFEQMLELLVNEDKEAAQELFHEIVVEKSRDIYESLLEDEDDIEEASDEEVDEAEEKEDDEEVDESSEEEVDEGFSLDEFEVEADPADMGGDPTDDLAADLGMDDEGGDDMGGDDMGGDGSVEDRVEDLEDALDDLKAEFERLMAGEDGEEAGDDMGMDDEEGEDDEEAGDDMGMDDEEPKEDAEGGSFQATVTPMSAGETMREYVEKVTNGHGAEKKGSGDNGANTKSAVAKPNNMGGTTANLRGGESKGEGTQGGLLNPSTKDMSTGNINVPGGKAGKTAFKKSEPGHGAEKKSSGDNGDKSTKSPINGLNSRAK